MVFTANANGPRGFDPVMAKNGTPTRMIQGRIAGAGSDSFFRGQPLEIDSNGLLIVVADDANAIVGVFAGVEYVTAAGDIRFSPTWDAPGAIATGSVVKVKLYDAFNNLFLIHSDEVLAQDDIGKFFALTTTVGTGGSTITGRSNAQLDASSVNASPAGLLVQCVDVSPRDEGDDEGGVLAIVQFIRSEYGANVDSAA